LCGGLAASLYRDQPRLTNDIDFIVASVDNVESRVVKIIEDFGLSPHPLCKADLDGGPLFAIKRKSTPVQVVVGRLPGDARAIGLDFLLSNIDWVPSAVERGQSNLVNFLNHAVPTITVEDLILAKLSAQQAAREKDIDDLKSIFKSGHELELDYLVAQMKRLSLSVPDSLLAVVPEPMKWISKSVRKRRSK
jgi:hypothetical protein